MLQDLQQQWLGGKWIRLKEGFLLQDQIICDKNDDKHSLTLNDVALYKNNPPGTTIYEDVSCDTKYMIENKRDIGKAIRNAYDWVTKEEKEFFGDGQCKGGMALGKLRMSM